MTHYTVYFSTCLGFAIKIHYIYYSFYYMNYQVQIGLSNREFTVIYHIYHFYKLSRQSRVLDMLVWSLLMPMYCSKYWFQALKITKINIYCINKLPCVFFASVCLKTVAIPSLLFPCILSDAAKKSLSVHVLYLLISSCVFSKTHPVLSCGQRYAIRNYFWYYYFAGNDWRLSKTILDRHQILVQIKSIYFF